MVQIRRGTPTEELYYVRTEVNAADISTRPEKISISHVMPDSVFHKRYDWMRMDVSDAEEAGYITHASKLRMKPEEESDFQQAILYMTLNEELNL